MNPSHLINPKTENETMMDRVQQFMQDNSHNILGAMFTAITFFDTVDFFFRCLSGFITVVMFCFSIRSYFRKKKIHEIEKKIKDQQLYDIIESNKKKYGNT